MAEIRSMYKCLILVALIACHAILSAEGRQIKSMNKKETNSGMGEIAKQQGSSISINSLQNTEGKKQIFPPPTMSLGDSKASYKHDFRPTTPGISSGVGNSFAQHQPNVESKLVSDKAEHFVTEAKEDFQPTAPPGISLGVGHSFFQHQQNVESKLVSDKAGHFVTSAKDDFRPTAPGHSPGIGHSFAQHHPNAESKLVSDKGEHFVTGAKDDFRPTAPGHSPGVGHSFAQHDQRNAESKLVYDKAGHYVTGVKDDFRPTAPGHSPGVGHAFGNKNAEPNG
ncbi:hypothetical protein ACOSQ4_023424 [Xanthoceras sorbifolium]